MRGAHSLRILSLCSQPGGKVEEQQQQQNDQYQTKSCYTNQFEIMKQFTYFGIWIILWCLRANCLTGGKQCDTTPTVWCFPYITACNANKKQQKNGLHKHQQKAHYKKLEMIVWGVSRTRCRHLSTTSNESKSFQLPTKVLNILYGSWE